MKKFKEWLLKDWWLKIVSVFLAIVIWFVWIQIENPTIPKDFSNIKVQIINEEALDPEKKVWDILDGDTVRVTVTAPKTVINSLSSADIIAEADASKIVDGKIPISLRLAGDMTYDSLTSSKDSVTLSIEDRARKYVRIIKNTTGEVAENCKFGGVTMDLNMIEINGPKSDIDMVSYGQVNINIDGVSESVSANIEIELYDASNNVLNLSTITKQSDYVHVDVNILETKQVAVYASKTGEPAPGYLYTGNLEVYPETVTLAGTHAALLSLSRINITTPIDITDADADVEKEVDLSQYVPTNVQFADDDFDKTVTVKVFIEPEEEKTVTFPADGITLTNVPDGYDIEIAPSIVSVTISGLKSNIEGIDALTIGKTVDVAAFMDNNDISELDEGDYHMPISLGLSSSINIKKGAEVKVTVKKK